MSQRRAFSLVEALTVIAILSALAVLMIPAVKKARAAAHDPVCRNNLRQMQTAFSLYLSEHGGRFFPYVQTNEGSRTHYYFGLSSPGAEGSRTLDKSRAALAPYLDQIGGVEICPAFPYGAPYIKAKYEMASYGYALNAGMLAGMPEWKSAGEPTWFNVTRPAETIAWADSAQVNVWQYPASPANPMLEEWYYLNNAPPPNLHFRHGGRVNAVMADGSVRSFPPAKLDPRCDGLTGFLSNQVFYLKVAK